MFLTTRFDSRARRRNSPLAGWLFSLLALGGIYSAAGQLISAAQRQTPPVQSLLAQNTEPATNPGGDSAAPEGETPSAQTDESGTTAVVTSDDTAEDSGLFSVTNLMIIGVLLSVCALIIVRRRRANSGWQQVDELPTQVLPVAPDTNYTDAQFNVGAQTAETKLAQKAERKLVEVPPLKAAPTRRAETASASSPAHAPTTALVTGKSAQQPANSVYNVTIFGAYRVEQEAEKLVAGKPHRVEVLASRAPDDRAAVENTLLRALQNKALDATEHARATRALEEYGFVARRCAALLLAPDGAERVATARVLGEIGAPAALPFLLEALYDFEEDVRLQAVVSLGDLKLPGAIGALLDLARRHPEMPSGLLQQSLNACSVDTSLDFLNMPRTPLLLDDEWNDEEWAAQPPLIGAEDLPVGDGDVGVMDALTQLENANTAEERANVANMLGLYPSQRSVMTLTYLAGNDPSPSVRTNAVLGLAEINHVSVFTPILLAVGDEAREVRASAARALSRLDFERSEAYVRLAETVEPGMLNLVAQACIRAGMAAQAIDRLASADQRLSYEAYTLLSLLVKAHELQPILEAIQNHENFETRVAAVRLLGSVNDKQITDSLRGLAVSDGMTDKLRTEILETLIKMDANKGRSENAGDNFAARVA